MASDDINTSEYMDKLPEDDDMSVTKASQDAESNYQVSSDGNLSARDPLLESSVNQEDEDTIPSYTWKRRDGSTREEEPDDDEEEEEEDEGFLEGVDDLPLFADDQNKQLHAQIKVKEQRLEKTESSVKETEVRLNVMMEHLKNVKQEVVNSQQLLTAKMRELESEEHLKHLSLREIGRIRQEMTQMEERNIVTTEKMNTVQNFIFKGNEKMDTFKAEMNFNQEELEQWSLAARQKDEDNLALQKYTRADESKIKELALEVEKLTKELQQVKTALEEEATETQAKQIELDKAGDEFRSLHAERQRLVLQWQGTIETMQRRDEEIQQAGITFGDHKVELAALNDDLGEHKQRLKIQEQENVEMESKTGAKERQHSKVRQELQDISAKLQEFKDEVEILKNELSSAAGQLMQKRTQNNNLSAELEDHKLDLEQAKNRLQATQKKLDRFKSVTMDAESIAKEAEEDMQEKENDLRRITKAIAQLKDLTFRQSQELFDLRQEEANLIAEISGAQAAGRNLQTKIKQLDQESLRQQELVYNGEFQIQQLERKVSRASGERSVDETKALKAQIEGLQVTLDQAKAQFSMLDAQCKKLGDERRRQQREQANCIKEQQQLQAKISELELENESSALSLQKALKLKQEKLVQHDVLMLDLQKLKDVLTERTDEVLTLENRKYQLQMSMEERKAEIAVHRDVLRAEMKGAEEERHRVSVEFSERRLRVDKLQAKYETLCKSAAFGVDDDDGSGEKSQAYFVIKAAQRREELQRKGDELDEKIRVAERELKGLRKTLKHLAVRNTEYRKSFHRADKSSVEAKKVAQLEEQSQAASDILFKRKKELQRLQTDLEDDTRRVEQMHAQTDHMRQHVDNLSNAYQQVSKDVQSQRDKLDRSKKRMARSIKKIRLERKSAKETPEEIAFQTYAIKEITTNVLYTLGQLVNEFPEISDDLHVALKEASLTIPSRPQSRISIILTSKADPSQLTRPMSARSDRSDISSGSTDSRSSVGSTRSSNQLRQPIAVNQVNLGL